MVLVDCIWNGIKGPGESSVGTQRRGKEILAVWLTLLKPFLQGSCFGCRQSQLWYIRQGKTALYVNFIARKEAQLAEDFVAEWSAVFKASEVVVLGEDGVEEGKD